jgi:hypothetical protein
LNRRTRALPLRAALLCALLLAITVAVSSAAPELRFLHQSLVTSIVTSAASVATSVGSLAGAVPPARARVNSPYHSIVPRTPRPGFTQRVPVWAMPHQRPFIDLRRQVPTGNATIQAVGQIGSTNAVPQLAIDQTTVPRPPQLGKSAVSDDAQPTWSPDEAWIYFTSNRGNADGTAAGTNYHVWRMSSDGNRVEQVTGTTGLDAGRDQFNPAIAPNGLLAYSERAGAGSQSNIVVLDLRDPMHPPIRTPVTGPGTDPRYALGDAIEPSWAPSSDSLALAANKAGVYNIYTISLRLGDVVQITNGASANGIDSRNPNWSPGGTLIAFDSNAAGVDAKTGLLAGTAPTRNVFVSYSSGPNSAGSNGTNTQPFVQMTNFPGANSIEPAFSPKVGGNAPNDTNNMRLLAFASQRADPNNSGKATTVVPTYHLFWIHADAGKSLPNSKDATPEDPSKNPPVSVFTQDTDPNLPAVSRYKANERHPSWPPFIRSIRMAYQSDLTGNNDIWTASFVDVNAPSLEAVNEGSSEIVRVARLAEASPAPNAIGRREFTPGDQVVIMARAQDLESGIARKLVDGKMVPIIYAQVRNPNGKYQSADGKEHKTYLRYDFGMPPGAPQNPIDKWSIRMMYTLQVPREESSQVLDVHDPLGTKYSDPWYPNTMPVPPPMPDPRDPMMTMMPPCPPFVPQYMVLPPTYVPGQDDLGAWSGAMAPPRAEWLPLYDDGPASKGGHEPEGQVAGDNVFSNVWQTPTVPSDYIIDIITYDQAFDPLGRGPGQNWKIWDNVWGITTAPFVVQNNILAVMDYPEGQRFLSTSTGGRFTSGGAIPVESYLLDLDANLYPKTLAPMDFNACPPEMLDTFISSTPKHGLLNTLGAFSFRNNGYDLWRVICRGPVDPSVLLSYAPTTVNQVDPAAFNQAPSPNGTYPMVQVPAAEKAVYWASPYSGDLWVGRGTITDAATQDLLTQFVHNKGGRLFITGQDVGWALTLNGSLNNSFFTNVLQAQFIQDSGADPNDGWKLKSVTDGDIATDWPNRDIAAILNPDAQEDPLDPVMNALTNTKAPRDPLYILSHGPDMVITDGALNQGFPDKIMPIAPAKAAYAYYDTGFGAVYNVDPMSGGRVVYLSFGLESLLREYESGDSGTQVVLNYRSKLLHNALCWATTGQIRGRVVDVQGLRPISGAVVRAIPNANKDGAVTRTAVTDANGNYNIRGLVPQPVYSVEASVPGYTSQHLNLNGIHGVGEFVDPGDLLVSAAAPGSISGTVTSSSGGPVPGAVVQAVLTVAPGYLGQVNFAASTNAQGQYRFGNLPIGGYTVTIPADYLTSSGFNNATPAMQTAGVQASKDSTGVNFVLGGGSTGTGTGGTGTGTGGTGTGTGGLKSFQTGLALFSVPYDYPNDDAATVLGLTPSDLTQKLATYMTDMSAFRFYADPAVKNLRLGRGYFVRLAKPAAVTKMGTPAPTTQAFSLALGAGWNLIGDPFTGSVQWSSVKVQVAGQTASLTLAQAIQQGVLKAGLLTLGGNPYRDSPTLDPWTGYWVRATRAVTLLIPPPGSAVTAATLPAWQPNEGSPPLP